MFCFPLVVFPGYRQINKVILAVIVFSLSLSRSRSLEAPAAFKQGPKRHL